jgi:hypothetical protein
MATGVTGWPAGKKRIWSVSGTGSPKRMTGSLPVSRTTGDAPRKTNRQEVPLQHAIMNLFLG